MNQRQNTEATKAMGHTEKGKAGTKIDYITFFFPEKKEKL